MSRQIGLVQRRRLLDKTKRKAEKDVAVAALKSLDRRFKALKRELRKSNLRKRLAKSEGLFKADDNWDEWADEFEQALVAALQAGAEAVGVVENIVWISRGYSKVNFSPSDIIDNYQERIGRKITNITEDTRTETQQIIADWFKTDQGLPELIDLLAPEFGETRAALIAANEMANVASEVSLEQMKELEITKFIWDAILDQFTCFDCEELNGQVFNLGDPMPPEGSHIGCRCGVLYADEDGNEL